MSGRRPARQTIGEHFELAAAGRPTSVSNEAGKASLTAKAEAKPSVRRPSLPTPVASCRVSSSLRTSAIRPSSTEREHGLTRARSGLRAAAGICGENVAALADPSAGAGPSLPICAMEAHATQNYRPTSINSAELIDGRIVRRSPHRGCRHLSGVDAADNCARVGTDRRLRCMRGLDADRCRTHRRDRGLQRVRAPRQLASFVGLVPCERSSGRPAPTGTITKAGSSHARRLPLEAA